jgi:hypothetical protein
VNANLDPASRGAIPSSYTVTGSSGRQAELRRLRSRGTRLELSAPAKDGTRRIYAALDLSERWATETLMMLHALCSRVDREGLPSLPGEAADAA